MYEVEQKVQADLEDVRARLADRGVERETSVRQRDVYFDHPTREFASTDEALRLREQTPEDATESVIRLTYKGPKLREDTKTREETETTVASFEATSEILEALGFTPVRTVEKTREVFPLGEYDVCLDEVADLGEFVEVEGVSPREDVEAVDEETREILRELGLDPGETITASYLELLLENDTT